MRLGVFGGTFDPPHLGHLIVARDAVEALELDRVLFIPARLPPHKRKQDVTPADVRLAMVEAAVDGDDRFAVSDLELCRAGPSYSVDTLRELIERHRGGECELFFLLGADQFREFHTWRDPEQVAALATVVVLSRGGDESIESPLDVPYDPLSVTRIDISATDIRRRVAAGRSIRYLVPAPVEAIIGREGLYRERVASAAGGRTDGS